MRTLFCSLLFFTLSSTAKALDVDWKLYMRSSVGTNSTGGKQYILSNPGARGNEFRLGNEGTYAEAYFTGHVLKASGAKDPFFDANLTFAYGAQMNSQYSDTTTNTDYASVVQAFAKGGNFDDLHFSAWAGKRFYRDVDLHMNDFFYFADMSGVGGGVEDIDVGNGTVAIALLQHSDNTVQKATNGIPSKQAIDLRLRDFNLFGHEALNFWLAAGYTAPGTGKKFNPPPTTGTGDPPTGSYDIPVDYEAGRGAAAGVRWRHAFDEKSHNDFAVMYGTGVMENFTMDSSVAYAQTGTKVNSRKRTRIVENPVLELEHWGISAGLVYEDADSGADSDSHSRWYSVGIRPIYYFTEHFHLAFEAGFSDVKVDSETFTGGGRTGDRTLTRITIAPEMALAKGFFSRPVLRAFISHTQWNQANEDQAPTSGSLITALNKQNLTGLGGRQDETQVGFQAEVWF